MKTVGNIIWFIFAGLWAFLAYIFIGALLCITIIGIPAGKQLFKIAGFILLPFGKTVETNYDKHPILNLIWIVLLGWEMAVGFLLAGLILCVTIIGIPFGKQCFKLISLALIPFGATYR